MKLTQMDEAYWIERRAEAEREFPGSSFGMRPDLTAEVVDRFEHALHAGSEEARTPIWCSTPSVSPAITAPGCIPNR